MTRKSEQDNNGEREREQDAISHGPGRFPVVITMPRTANSCPSVCPRAQESQDAAGKDGGRRNHCLIPRLRKSQTEIPKVFELEALWPGLPSRESSYNIERRKEGILQGSPLETAFGASEPLNSTGWNRMKRVSKCVTMGPGK